MSRIKNKKKKSSNKKKNLKFLLALSLLLIMSFSAITAEQGIYMKEADQLLRLGVLKGTGYGYDLERKPTRLEGLVMAVRLVGKEESAQKLEDEPCLFSDVPQWGRGYANYAIEFKIAKGIGNNLFDPNGTLSAKDYITFMLRTLEYDESDFTYEKSIEFAYKIGLLSEIDLLEIKSQSFLRDHLVKITMLTLKTNMKDKSISLIDKLVEEGAISKSDASQITMVDGINLEVHFIDVGQGDSILIKKGTESMLIDAGNNSDGELVVNYLKEQNVSKLNYVVGTHPHEDHIGGLDNVIHSFDIEKVIMPRAISTTKTFEDVLDSMKNKGLSITKPNVGDTYDLNGATATILGPNQSEYGDLNNYSIVIKVVNGDNTYLFTGDADTLSENEIVKVNAYHLKADVLKVGHHGSSTSTSKNFLDAISPNYAVISVGEDNIYEHPNKEVLDRLENKGIEVFRTDLEGTIISISDGKSITFNKIND